MLVFEWIPLLNGQYLDHHCTHLKRTVFPHQTTISLLQNFAQFLTFSVFNTCFMLAQINHSNLAAQIVPVDSNCLPHV